MKKLITIFFLLSVLFAVGQEERKYDRIISMSDFQNMLRTQKVVELTNTYVKLQYKHIQLTDKEFRSGKLPYEGEDAIFFEGIYSEDGALIGSKPVAMTEIQGVRVYFKDCKFDRFWVDSCEFSSIQFVNCDIGKLALDNSEFNFFEIKIGTFSFSDLSISNCKFNDIVNWSYLNLGTTLYKNALVGFINGSSFNGLNLNGDFKSLEIEGNTFKYFTGFDHVKVHDLMKVRNNTFVIDSTINRPADKKYWKEPRNRKFIYDEFFFPSLVTFEESEINQLEISENKFEYLDNRLTEQVYNFDFEGTDMQEFTMEKESLQRLSFNNTSFTKQFSMDSVIINKDFSAKGITLPEYNVDFTWGVLKDKLSFKLNDSTNYKALTDKELANEKSYNSFIRSYKKFFSIFKNGGDLKSANACYVEMKDVETRRLKYLYETEGGVDRLLNYRLNTFLKFFAEYGTSPIKSVKISGWVILIFGFFYFFFYSEWDKINRKFLMEKSGALIGYFRSEQKLEDLYSDTHKEELNTFNDFKQNLKESKTEVPFFFMLFLKPLYWVAVIKHKFNKSLYKRVEFLQGRWVDLTSGKKFFLGTLTFLAILTYGLYLVAIRSLNSLILSINTFTTLGFGDIPVVGISRYVAILEGFLGWFLLSIFSVSLISQILQN